MITLIDLFLIFLIAFIFLIYFTDYRIFVHTRYHLSKENSDFITIHFTHGYLPKWNFRKYVKLATYRAGGYVSMQIDKHIYGFRVAEGFMHFIPQEHRADFNAKFIFRTFLLWTEEKRDEMTTSVKIPVTEEQKKALIKIYNAYMVKTPYDYAFLGMGSASSLYEILAQVGIVATQQSHYRYIFYAFYPRIFRQRMLAWARFNDFEVSVKQGTDHFYWEK
jgi:hypothetical protein